LPNDFPLAPEQIKVKNKMLSHYCQCIKASIYLNWTSSKADFNIEQSTKIRSSSSKPEILSSSWTETDQSSPCSEIQSVTLVEGLYRF